MTNKNNGALWQYPDWILTKYIFLTSTTPRLVIIQISGRLLFNCNSSYYSRIVCGNFCYNGIVSEFNKFSVGFTLFWRSSTVPVECYGYRCYHLYRYLPGNGSLFFVRKVFTKKQTTFIGRNESVVFCNDQ